jgi:hypothetical protein
VLVAHARRKRRDQEEKQGADSLKPMDYHKMKALMEASREKSPRQREAEPEEFPKADSRPDWKYLGYVARERMAA